MTDNITSQEPSEGQATEKPASIASELSPGTQLQRARVAAGLSREQLAQRLCITTAKLGQLESDQYNSLPGTPYVRGYLRNACKALKVDPAPLLETLEHNVGSEDRRQMTTGRLVQAPLLQQSRRAGQVMFRAGALIFLVVVAGALWLLDRRYSVFTAEIFGFAGAPAPAANVLVVSSHTAQMSAKAEPAAPLSKFASSAGAQAQERREASAALPVLAEEQVGQVVGITDVFATTEAVKAAPEVDKEAAALALQFSQDAWIKVIDGHGATLLAKVQPAGSVVELSGAPPFQLMLGNAAATTVSYRGEEVESAPIGDQRTRKLLVGGG